MIEIRLDYVTAEEVENLAERFADILVEGGLGEEPEGDDMVVKSLIAVRPYEWPEDPETLVKDELAGHSLIVIPSKGDED